LAEAAQKNFKVFFFGAALELLRKQNKNAKLFIQVFQLSVAGTDTLKKFDNHSLLRKSITVVPICFSWPWSTKTRKVAGKYEDTLNPSLLMGIGAALML
jgi:hypothetical protein